MAPNGSNGPFQGWGQQAAFIQRHSLRQRTLLQDIDSIPPAPLDFGSERAAAWHAAIDKLDEPPIFRIARLQFQATGNALWPLWMLSLRSQGGLSPPRWVGEFLLSLSNLVWKGAAAPRHPDETVEDTNFSDQSFLEALGFKKKPGQKDRFVEFRQTLTDVFLALEAEELRSSGAKLIDACKQIAKREGIETTNKAFKEYNWRYVYTAHHRWFMADGRMRLRPGVRNPRKLLSPSARSQIFR